MKVGRTLFAALLVTALIETACPAEVLPAKAAAGQVALTRHVVGHSTGLVHPYKSAASGKVSGHQRFDADATPSFAVAPGASAPLVVAASTPAFFSSASHPCATRAPPRLGS